MPPTQTVEQRNRALEAAGVTQSQIDQNAITASQLGGVASPFQVPEFTPTSPDQVKNEIAGIPTYQDLFDRVYGQKSGAEQTGSDLAGTLLGEYKSIIEKGGFVNEDGTINTDQARAQQEIQAGIPEQERQALNLSNQLTSLQNESLAIPSLIQEQFTGRGATQAGVEPIQTAELRRNLIKSLSVSAQLQAVQGNIALARQQVDRAIQAEFQPYEARLSLVSKAYELNKDELKREAPQKAALLEGLISERTRLLDIQKAEKESVYGVMETVAANGAPSSVLNEIAQAKTYREAVVAAGEYAQDPKVKLELESLRLTNALRRVQIDREQKELSLLGEPTEEDIKNTEKAMREAETSIQVAQDKLDAIDLLKDHVGLRARVGTVPYLSRSKVSAAEFTGEGQDFAGGIHKLVSGLTLDSLIEAKARGATFGALSDTELGILAAAASAIADWEVKDSKGRGIGTWNIDEASFKRELNTIQELTQRAIERSQGTLFSSEEDTQLDNIFSEDGSALINPAGYF